MDFAAFDQLNGRPRESPISEGASRKGRVGGGTWSPRARMNDQTKRLPNGQTFEEFVADVQPKLRQAMVARFGLEVGREATADAMAYSFEHWDSLSLIENPVGYLFRVGQTSARKQFRWSNPPVLPEPPPDRLPDVEPQLPRALTMLSDERRVIVMLIHAHDWTYAAVGELLGIPVWKVRNELHRGLQQLRHHLGEVIQ